MPLGVDTSFMQYIDPELAGSGQTIEGTGEQYGASPGSTAPVGGYDVRKPPRWAQILAGAAAGWQDPSFAARSMAHDEDVAREQAFTRQQQASSQNFDLKKAAVVAAQQLREHAYTSQLRKDEEANQVRLQEEARQRFIAEQDKRNKGFFDAAQVNNPVRTSASPIGGLTLPNRVPTAEEGFAKLQVEPMLEPGLRNALTQQQIKTSAESGNYMQHHGGYLDALAAKAKEAGISDDTVIDSKLIPVIAEITGKRVFQLQGLIGKKVKEAKALFGSFRPPTTIALDQILGNLGGAGGGTSAAPNVVPPAGNAGTFNW